MSSMISQISERIASLESSLRALEAEQNELHTEIQQLREENGKLRSGNEMLGQEIEELKGKGEKLRGHSEELRQQCDSLDRESSELRAAASLDHARAEAWEKAYEDLKQAVRDALEKQTAPSSARSSVTDELEDESLLVDEPEDAVGEAKPVEGDLISTTSSSEAMAAEETPAYELIAFPFERFSDLRAFQEAIRALPGTTDVRLRHFDKGTLELRVEYLGEELFEDALSGLEAFSGTVTVDANGRYAFRVVPRGPAQ